MLHQFDQGTRQVRRVNKRDSCTTPADARKLVDQTGAPGREMGQCLVDVENCIGNVMKTLAAPLEKATDRSMWRQGTQQLNERPSDRDHRFFDPLIGHDLPVDRLDSISIEVAGNGAVEVVDGDADMIEVVQLHLPKVRRARSRVENLVLARRTHARAWVLRARTERVGEPGQAEAPE
jgi:hypothetical protein